MRIVPYLHFNDTKCREAMVFYKDCLGGELTFQTVGESPMAAEMAKDMPPETQDKIMHATLKNGEFEIYASDMMQDKAVIGDNVSVSVMNDNKEEATKIFSKLSEGGNIFMPFEKAFWGAYFGVLTDKYGIEWMVNCDIKE